MKKSDPAAVPSATPAAHCAVRLRAAVSHLHRQLRSAQPAEGISVAKLSTLAHLYRAGSLTPSELARRERVKLQSLTRLLAELEADGWLLRKSHESDARQSVLSLTRAGVRMLTADVHRREAALMNAMQSLAPDELDALTAACALIDRIADGIETDRAPPIVAVAAMSAKT